MAIRQDVSARSRAAYPQSLTIHNAFDVIVKGPIRVLYFLFAPFPRLVRDVVDLLGLLDSFLYAGLIVLTWRMRRRILLNFPLRALTYAFIAIVAVIALAVGNYGTAIRHRAKIVVVPIVIVAGYISYKRSLLVDNSNSSQIGINEKPKS